MNPILNEIGTTFIPVRDIEQARDWYCELLGVKADGEVLFGHLYMLPMKGTGIALDSKIYSKDAVFNVPAFHFNTNDINEAYQFMKHRNVELLTEIEHNQWFTFKDPDGNILMISEC